MTKKRRISIRNDHVAISVDDHARVISLKNVRSGTELITAREGIGSWRMIVPTGKHTIAFVSGDDQNTPKIEARKNRTGSTLTITYPSLQMDGQRLDVRVHLRFTLDNSSPEIRMSVNVDNKSKHTIDEIEFPIIGGIGALPAGKGKSELHLVQAQHSGQFHDDVLHDGFPNTGNASNHFARAHQTAMFPCGGFPDVVGNSFDRDGVWMDLYSRQQGLYFGFHPTSREMFAWKLEKCPKEVPNVGRHDYPPDTPRWLRAAALHMPRIGPHKKWRSDSAVIIPHKGDWHVGADAFSAYKHEHLMTCEPPKWMNDFVGWTEILGKTYLGEFFHTYKQCADEVIKDYKKTGINVVFYYGHTKLGADGADFDNGPSPDLGGKKGFRLMIDRLHKQGIRVLLLDHIHRFVNQGAPQYQRLGLERFAVLDSDGKTMTSRWWKETGLSCIHSSGPTPVWTHMCPYCEEWQEYYIKHVTDMIKLGVDGLELDCYWPTPCFNPDHGHPVGMDMFQTKLAWMRRVRAHAKSLNPDFVLIGEDMVPENREVLDGYYSSGRCLDDNDTIFRYMFPELRQHSVLVGNYAYNQVNKALQLGLGIDTEIDGLRKTCAASCPELADYIGEINKFKRHHPAILMQGTFRDTVGADVKGDVFFAVHVADDGRQALVLRNPHREKRRASATLKRVEKGRRTTLWRPGSIERPVMNQPVEITIPPHRVAIVLAT